MLKKSFIDPAKCGKHVCVCLRLFFLSAVDDAVLQERKKENRFVWGKRNVSSSVLWGEMVVVGVRKRRGKKRCLVCVGGR